jgi:hypothetical protein
VKRVEAGASSGAPVVGAADEPSNASALTPQPPLARAGSARSWGSQRAVKAPALAPTQAPAPVASTDSSWLTTALVTLGIVAAAAAGFVFMRRRSAGSAESTD